MGNLNYVSKRYKIQQIFPTRPFLILSLLALMLTASSLGFAGTFTVNSTGDLPDSYPGDGICSTRGRPAPDAEPYNTECTLRAAIDEANADVGKDVIHIVPRELQPKAPLPHITHPVEIYSAGTTKTVIDGVNAGPNAHGLVLRGGDSVVSGLAICRFSGYGIVLWGGNNNHIYGNYVGIDRGGTSVVHGNGSAGIAIINSSNNTIGGQSPRQRNVISCNKEHGVFIDSGSNNTISANYVGVDKTSTLDRGNKGIGVFIVDANDNTVGGDLNELYRNVISGNDSHGVLIQNGTDNKVIGNRIGTDHWGKIDNIGNGGCGVFILRGQNNKIGRVNSLWSRNVISNNGSYGVLIKGGRDNHVEANRIGTDENGELDFGNTKSGVVIRNSSTNHIGYAIRRSSNLISGNNENGILIDGKGSRGNIIKGNRIGTNVNGTKPLGNAEKGIFISQAPDTVVGGDKPAATNTISGNSEEGIYIQGKDASGNTIVGNYVGTNDTGDGPLPNAKAGIRIVNAPDNTIGGDREEERNIISANDKDGIIIQGREAKGNTVTGNYIGIDIKGEKAMGNNGMGIALVDAPENTIGGDTAGKRNVISGNKRCGINIQGREAKNNTIIGNFIGTDADGLKGIPNKRDGIYIREAPKNTIGGAKPEEKNVISGNKDDGVHIGGKGAEGNTIIGNYIGTKKDGTSPLPNSDDGVSIWNDAANNFVGGLSRVEGNVIAFNKGTGVTVGHNNTTGNAILSNSIFSNGELGIDLVGSRGVDHNDEDDSDPGPNKLQNFPILMIDEHNRNIVDGLLESTHDKKFHIQVFENDDKDPSLHGEGKRLIGQTMTTTDNNGKAIFNVAVTPTSSKFITATATGFTEDTSEFSSIARLIDLDIDSDNNSSEKDSSPQRDRKEDEIESDEYYRRGRIIVVNDNDDDNDGVDDYFDSFNNTESNLVKMILEISKSVDLNKAEINVSYEAAQPWSKGSPPQPYPGRLRIWTEDPRSKRSEDKPPAGDYLAPGIYETKKLEFTNHKKDLWLEGVRPSPKVGGDVILVKLDPDGPGQAKFDSADAVRVTVMPGMDQIVCMHFCKFRKAGSSFKYTHVHLYYDTPDLVNGVGHDDDRNNPSHPHYTTISRYNKCDFHKNPGTPTTAKPYFHPTGTMGPQAYFHQSKNQECPPGFKRIKCQCKGVTEEIWVCYTLDFHAFERWRISQP